MSKSSTLQDFLDANDAKPTVSFNYTGTPSGHKEVILNYEYPINTRK